MRVLLCVEQRFDRTPDGVVWTSGHYAYSFLQRYLGPSREVVVLARVRNVGSRPTRARQTSGPGVSMAPTPYYIGPSGFLRSGLAVMWSAGRAAWRADAIIMRLPSMTATIAALVGRLRSVPVLAEVIGDPDEVFAPRSFSHPLRALIRAISTRTQSLACRQAAAVCYVGQSLAQKYPSKGQGIVCADCAIPRDWFADAPRHDFGQGCLRLVSIGTMEVPYKRHDVLLRAVRRSMEHPSRPKITVDLLGDGRLRHDLERLAAELGLADCVTFHGFVADRELLRDHLDRAHLLVHTSVTEGMPNVIIEAMARALPCISTPVGGVPELLPEECLFPVDDEDALASELVRLAHSPDVLMEQSRRNLHRSRDFSDDRWHERFSAFMSHLSGKEEVFG